MYGVGVVLEGKSTTTPERGRSSLCNSGTIERVTVPGALRAKCGGRKGLVDMSQTLYDLGVSFAMLDIAARLLGSFEGCKQEN